MKRLNPQLAESLKSTDLAEASRSVLPSMVRRLETLVECGTKFSTIYADPPWPYRNTAARGAAENHYRTMPLQEICDEPVRDLVADDAHLHLWTTNAFLREAFDVIRAWGFRYKSCLVWIKPQLGMGNYWRVSHEYLLFGVRGNLPFQTHTSRSWLVANRSVHSRKPFAFRKLIEQVSPGPYLELYGREEHPDTEWTVYGNQVERRLC
jgi:N6-adenosine-specific RNA methylase IME4